MNKKCKLNPDEFKGFEVVSLNDDNVIYRIQIPQQKNLTLQERHKIQRNFNDTTIHYFNIDDLNILRQIEQKVHMEEQKHSSKKSMLTYISDFFDI